MGKLGNGETGAVDQSLKRKRPNGRDFKNMWRSMNKKPKGSGEPVQLGERQPKRKDLSTDPPSRATRKTVCRFDDLFKAPLEKENECRKKTTVVQPFRMELERLEMEKKYRFQLHEFKILQIKAHIQEMDQIRKKYDLLLHNTEIAFNEAMKDFEAKRTKVFHHKKLAEAMISQGSGSRIVASTSAEPLADPGQALASPSKKSTSFIQPRQAFLGHTTTPFSPNRFHGAYGLRAPSCAPHLRSSRPDPMRPFTAPNGGITLLPKIAQQMMSKEHTRKSPGLLL